MIHLRRIDPTRNMARFYAMAVQPTLFGEWSLQREWGPHWQRWAPGLDWIHLRERRRGRDGARAQGEAAARVCRELSSVEHVALGRPRLSDRPSGPTLGERRPIGIDPCGRAGR